MKLPVDRLVFTVFLGYLVYVSCSMAVLCLLREDVVEFCGLAAARRARSPFKINLI